MGYFGRSRIQKAVSSDSGQRSGRTSVSASVTVEAAVAVPLFFFAVLCLVYLLELMAVGTAVRAGLQYAGKRAAEDAAVVTALLPSRVEADVVENIGADRLDRSIIVGGSSGIDCSRSRLSPVTGIGEVTAVYLVEIPVPFFEILPVEYEESLRIKAWTGYEKGGFGDEDDETVYITETGMVYHRDYHCSYLDLSVRMVSREEVGGLRNENGGKYTACQQCKGSGGLVFITDYGDRYHSSPSCGGLKRTVYAIPLSEAVGKGACSKCGH